MQVQKQIIDSQLFKLKPVLNQAEKVINGEFSRDIAAEVNKAFKSENDSEFKSVYEKIIVSMKEALKAKDSMIEHLNEMIDHLPNEFQHLITPSQRLQLKDEANTDLQVVQPTKLKQELKPAISTFKNFEPFGKQIMRNETSEEIKV